MISIVLPCWNEESVIPLLAERLRPVLDGLGEYYEVIFVDDGSTDGTAALLAHLSDVWPEVVVRRLQRNVGHQMAITAGLDAATGEWVITMDSDLQDPPELIPEMLRRAKADGVDVVYARRIDRTSDSAFKRSTAALYYRLVQRITDVSPPPQVGDYRLLSSRVVTALRMLPERHRVYRLLIPYLGFGSSVVEYRRDARAAGAPKYSLRRMSLLAVNSVTSFSTTPLRISTLVGLTTATASLLLAVGSVIAYVAGLTVPGWASITVGMLFLGAVQLICIGVLGEYVGRIFEEVQRRPLYSVESDLRRLSTPGRVTPGVVPRQGA